MRALIQRTTSCSVLINSEELREAKAGLLVFLGIEDADQQQDVSWLVNKIKSLRIFNDDDGVMNRSIVDVNGDFMVISQFTLFASTKKGNRPSYIRSAKPGKSEPLYNQFLQSLKSESGLRVVNGEFGAHMEVSLVNDGPVTIMIDSQNKE